MTAPFRITVGGIFHQVLFILPIFAGAGQEPIPEPLFIRTPLMEVRFTPEGDILSINARYQNVNRRETRADFSNLEVAPLLKVGFPGVALSVANDDISWDRSQSENDISISVSFRCGPVVKSYLLRKNSYVVDIAVSAAEPPPSCTDSVAFILRPASLRGDAYRRLAVNGSNNSVDYGRRIRETAATDYSWYGARNRFWTVMMKPTAAASVAVRDSVCSVSAPLSGALSSGATLYAGPIVYSELNKAGHECTKLLYPLWFWMRWLSFGLQYMFDLLLGMIRNTIIAVVALSVCVKIIIAPLFCIAHRWQKQVNVQKSLLQPRLDEINKTCKGEEHNRRTLAVYKDLGIHPLYSLKSLLSAVIQIPVFFAAYHMLSEHIALEGVGFLWIGDLSLPDRLFLLPISLPYFGAHFNLLPCLMTAITVAASWIHIDRTLTPSLLMKQRQSLYFMAGLFFIFLYTSSAGMVMYWTMNNILAFFATLLEFISHKNRAV